MGKAAGIWKKVKNVAKTIGGKFKKAFEWANENIIHPNKDIIKRVIEPYDRHGYLTDVIEKTSDYVHDHTDQDNVDTRYKDQIRGAVNTVIDETQGGYGDDYDEEGREYDNGFHDATPINNMIRTGIRVGKQILNKGRQRLGEGSNW